MQTNHQARRPNLGMIRKSKRTGCPVDFAVLADHRVKIKEGEKKDKYLDVVRKLRKVWKMRMTVISVVIGALGTAPKCLERGLEGLKIRGQIEILQTITL